MRTIQQFLLSFILAGAVMANDTDTQAYRDSLKQHPNQAVQAAVQQYNQGLCTVADILRAEEKFLAAELATTDKTHFTALAEQLIRNYKEQIRLEEAVSGGSSTHSLQLRQKLYALEIDVLKNSH